MGRQRAGPRAAVVAKAATRNNLLKVEGGGKRADLQLGGILSGPRLVGRAGRGRVARRGKKRNEK